MSMTTPARLTAAERREQLLQVALTVFAQGGVLQLLGESLRYAFTDAFATRLIVNPKNG